MKALHVYAIAVTILFILSVCWGGFNYIQKKSCEQQQTYAEKVARKDSIKAKQADNRLINVARPDSIKINGTTGQTILYISNNNIATNPVPSLVQSALPDTNFYYTQAQIAVGKKYEIAAQKQADIIDNQNAVIAKITHANDSLSSRNFSFKDKYISVAQIKSGRARDSADSVSHIYNAVLIPNLSFRGSGRHFLGLPQWDTGRIKKEKNLAVLSFTSPDPALRFYGTDSTYSLALRQPKMGGALQATFNRSSIGHISAGIGARGYWKNYNVYFVWYYDLNRKAFLPQPTLSVSKSIITF